MTEPEPIEILADAIVTLINSQPSTPTRQQFIELLWRTRQGLSVTPDPRGGVYFVSGNHDDLRAAGILRT